MSGSATVPTVPCGLLECPVCLMLVQAPWVAVPGGRAGGVTCRLDCCWHLDVGLSFPATFFQGVN